MARSPELQTKDFSFFSMAKDPAFLFYPGDWLGGTMGMTFEEKGAYLELLVMQWHCRRIAKPNAIRVVGLELWQKISAKFSEDKEGFYNKRLELEVIKRKQHAEKQSINAKKRWNSSNKNYVCDGIANAMPLENENINRNEDEIIKGVQGENELTISDVDNTIEYVDRIKQVKLTAKEVINFWEAFKLNQAEPAYLSRSKKIKHFRDWLKNQQHGHKPNSNSNGTHLSARDRQAAAGEKLLNKLRDITGRSTANT